MWVGYRDNVDGDIRLASSDGTNPWSFLVLDGNGGGGGKTSDLCAGPFVMAIGSAIGVFYVAQESGGHVNLRHASWSGTGSWSYAVRDGQSGMGTTETMSNAMISGTMYSGYPHIFYESFDGFAHTTLRHAYDSSGGWSYQAVDGHSSSGGRTLNDVGNSAVAIQNSKIHLYYMDYTDGNLRHAYGTGSSWTYETSDGHTSDQGGRVNGYVGLYPATLDWNYAVALYQGEWTIRVGVGTAP